MKKDIENQLMKLLKQLVSAIEERDVKSIGTFLDPATLVSVFGAVYSGKELIAALPVFVDSIEEVTIKVNELTNFRESEELSSFAFNVEISFVETTRWTLNRYKLVATTAYSIQGAAVKIKALILSGLALDSVRQPDFADPLGASMASPQMYPPGYRVPGFEPPGSDYSLRFAGISSDEFVPGFQGAMSMPSYLTSYLMQFYPMGHPMQSYPMGHPMQSHSMMPATPNMPMGYTPNPFPSPYPSPYPYPYPFPFPPYQWGGSFPWGGGHIGGVSG